MFKYNEQFINESDINSELMNIYSLYNSNYILQKIHYLRSLDIITPDPSISGWNIFIRNYTINKLNGIIKSDTDISKKKLYFTKYYLFYNNDYDILQSICNLI